MLAYDATIKGWSRAMDLRDKVTEDHTQRIVDLTIILAENLGIRGNDLRNIRWGALLHDIGKIGVPDSILLKPGKLTDAEMDVMRTHPTLAYEMLMPIRYLRNAIDIPYCHHEKWDGSGYPRGVKGEDIPLSARLFSVVDVWDSLTTDRVYRKALGKVEARKLIAEQAGSSFDPKIVDLFLKELDSRENS
jgi:putative nucleotidyltransferase with HDIG domain